MTQNANAEYLTFFCWF